MKPERTVLVVDDEEYVRQSLAEMVGGESDLRALAAASTDEAMALLQRESVDVVLADLQMPCGGAQALLERTRPDGDGADGGPPVIVITGVGTVPRAVEAMKAGAFDFVSKPIEPDALILLLRRALEHRRLLGQVNFLRGALSARRHRLAGESPQMAHVRGLIEQVAPTDATVLITGESGTGKELVAEEIHFRSTRTAANLVRVNCAAVPESLFESEFFGHRRGSFSGAMEDRSGRFAEAEGGTLVLDEIGTLRPEMQAKLLRVLESGEYQIVGEQGTRIADARVIAISNEPLATRVEEGTFRADLYYRLAIFPIELPPLRERPEDVVPLARQFLARLRSPGAPAAELEAAELAPGVDDILHAYHWPGNVRELRNLIERASILAGTEAPDAALFESVLEPVLRQPTTHGSEGQHLRTRLAETEREILREALESSGGRRKEAAARLGIDPRNLSYYLRKHDL